ncbi:BZ3500_MvSof-1268-A1-R1_Chr5-3g08328 [Microbotryum saponariae]|uniref:BZ3500_MvSof-1268-A1-R1_Chr5-3g08328 protein n=1 Tax=Microbotryum saponariae TaxID=289078 RepID=A0A2X0NQB5_9BASI|nr:BZ3500_MvSof-1268-A1-R1_Chr5-3g08328 [Microbotryum saponariae]SDA08436.1 BZ3501_MvSof-1269-A2-R1_Chr5-3g08056 [Microbotryum saponariae]
MQDVTMEDASTWVPGPAITILAKVAPEADKWRDVFSAPVGWMAQTGTMNWSYIVDCLSMFFLHPGYGHLLDEAGKQVAVAGPRAAVPTAEQYYYVRNEYDLFRDGVRGRDGTCLLSDAPQCMVTSFVPGFRTDASVAMRRLLVQVFASIGVQSQWLPACGILLHADLAKAFDAYDFALWPFGEDSYVVIVFLVRNQNLRPYHAKIKLPRQRFCGAMHTLPHRELCMWHHNQCALKHLRNNRASRWHISENADVK